MGRRDKSSIFGAVRIKKKVLADNLKRAREAYRQKRAQMQQEQVNLANENIASDLTKDNDDVPQFRSPTSLDHVDISAMDSVFDTPRKAKLRTRLESSPHQDSAEVCLTPAPSTSNSSTVAVDRGSQNKPETVQDQATVNKG